MVKALKDVTFIGCLSILSALHTSLSPSFAVYKVCSVENKVKCRNEVNSISMHTASLVSLIKELTLLYIVVRLYK